MTDDRSLERAARSFIEVGPTQAPEAAVEAALLRIQSTSQERDWFPWRLPHMTTPLRLALLVGAAVLAIAGVGLLTTGGPGPGPGPSPSSSPSASPSPGAIVPVRMPDAILGDWQTEADAISGVSADGDHLQLSVDWDAGETAWIQTPRGGDFALRSTAVAAAADGLSFVSTHRLGGCDLGDEGHYHWERSTDGLFLTLTVLEEACEARAAAFGRTWVHSLSAVNDGGPGVIPFDPWIQATLPSMRWAMSGATDGPVIHTFDSLVELTVMRNPMGFDAPCATTGRVAVPIEPSAVAITEYLADLPGLSVTSADDSVDGRPAVHLTIESDAGVDCPAGEIMAFHPPVASEDGEYTMALGDPRSFWIVELDGDAYVLWYAGEGVTAADEEAVIDSIHFLDALPTP